VDRVSAFSALSILKSDFHAPGVTAPGAFFLLEENAKNISKRGFQ
jgi:hypothetical protein